jgi:transmembrane sensor
MTGKRTRKPPEDEAIEAMAAAWLAQRDDGLTPEEEREFARWRAGDPRREAVVTRLEKTWSTLQRLRDFRPESPSHPDRDLLTRRDERRGSPLAMLAGAAVFATLLAAAVLWMRPSWMSSAPASTGPTRYATTEGGYQRITLVDGSVIVLNASSEVQPALSAAERRVRLLRGEAHFIVAKDPARTFRVEAGSVEVCAVGTAFNVRMAPTRIEVLVTEGRVQVEDARQTPGATQRPSEAPDFSGASYLDAGNRMIVTVGTTLPVPPSPRIELLEPQAIRAELSWQEPWLVFVDTPLAEVVAQFNRRNHVQLAIDDAQLAGLPIGGTFRAENLEAFVRLLSTNKDVLVERPDPEHILLRARK